MKHRQIVTLAIEFDPSQTPPPEAWQWDAFGAAAGADIVVLATGAPVRVEETKRA